MNFTHTKLRRAINLSVSGLSHKITQFGTNGMVLLKETWPNNTRLRTSSLDGSKQVNIGTWTAGAAREFENYYLSPAGGYVAVHTKSSTYPYNPAIVTLFPTSGAASYDLISTYSIYNQIIFSADDAHLVYTIADGSGSTAKNSIASVSNVPGATSVTHASNTSVGYYRPIVAWPNEMIYSACAAYSYNCSNRTGLLRVSYTSTSPTMIINSNHDEVYVSKDLLVYSLASTTSNSLYQLKAGQSPVSMNANYRSWKLYNVGPQGATYCDYDANNQICTNYSLINLTTGVFSSLGADFTCETNKANLNCWGTSIASSMAPSNKIKWASLSAPTATQLGVANQIYSSFADDAGISYLPFRDANNLLNVINLSTGTTKQLDTVAASNFCDFVVAPDQSTLFYRANGSIKSAPLTGSASVIQFAEGYLAFFYPGYLFFKNQASSPSGPLNAFSQVPLTGGTATPIDTGFSGAPVIGDKGVLYFNSDLYYLPMP